MTTTSAVPPASPSPPSWLRWRAAPVVAFLFALVALLTVALVLYVTPPRIVTGLPNDPGADSALSLTRGKLPPFAGGLRFESALTGAWAAGDSPDPGEPTAEQMTALRDAARALESARTRHPGDARLIAALGHLDLAELRYERAIRHYRDAIASAPTYGEARLGLGVALALMAETLRDPAVARGLRLRSVAQFAAVPEADPVYRAALYDRAVLLMHVDRADEAHALAARYHALDPASAWTAALDRAVAGPINGSR